MAKGMLSLTVALLLSAMCTVEGQSAASGASAAGGGGAAAATAAAGGGDAEPGYIGPRYLPSGYNGPQYVNSPYYTYLPRRTSSNVFAPIEENKRSGLGFFTNILNHALKIKAFTNKNGVANPSPYSFY